MRVNGFRVSAKMAKKVKGFALYDNVSYKGATWVITSLRTCGNFNLTRFVDGAADRVGYKWVSKRSAANGWVTERVAANVPRGGASGQQECVDFRKGGLV